MIKSLKEIFEFFGPDAKYITKEETCVQVWMEKPQYTEHGWNCFLSMPTELAWFLPCEIEEWKDEKDESKMIADRKKL